jgi:hypothetical protein
MNVNIKPPAMLLFLVFHKITIELKVSPHLKIYQHTKCYGPILTSTSFEYTSEV